MNGSFNAMNMKWTVSFLIGAVVLVGGGGQAQTQAQSTQTGTAATPSSQDKRRTKNPENEKDFDWVIYVQDSTTVTNGPMHSKITLDLKARNMSGGIIGDYYGSATATTTNDMSGKGGKITAPFVSKSTSLKLQVGPYLTPLTPTGDGPGLAPLKTEPPDYSGSGTITMSSKGVGTVSAKGHSTSRGISNDSTVPIEVNIIGPRVRLTARMPQGEVYFDGYIRGEGKTNDVLTPLEPIGDKGPELTPLEPITD